MYKALKEIGGYHVGDIVPDEKAEIWLKMYGIPHVEKVEGNSKIEKEEKVETPKEEPENSSGTILDDYLARGRNVVCKNILEDDLSEEQLENLLEIEGSNKNRRPVIKAIKKKLEGLK